MTKRGKRIAALRAHPKGVRFEDACRMAESLGLECQGGQGAHRIDGRFGESSLVGATREHAVRGGGTGRRFHRRGAQECWD